MSHLRRVGGRFVTHDAHTTYTRALVAPASTWTQEWVTPAGVPSGSKFKVHKWVRSQDKQDFSDEDSEDEEAEGFEDNSAPTLILPPQPGVAPSPSAVKAEPSSLLASPAPERPSSSASIAPESAPVAAQIPSTTSTLAPEPIAQFAAQPSPAMAVDSPAPAHHLSGEASVLPGGEMSVTDADGADPEGEGRRIAEGALEGPPADGTGRVDTGLPVEIEASSLGVPPPPPAPVAASEDVTMTE